MQFNILMIPYIHLIQPKSHWIYQENLHYILQDLKEQKF